MNLPKLKIWSNKNTLFSMTKLKVSFDCQSDYSRSYRVREIVTWGLYLYELWL